MLPPKPNNFRAPGIVDWAKLTGASPHFPTQHKRTGRRLQGVKYEAKVQEMLIAKFTGNYLPSPWLYFKGSSGVHWCQPDGLLFDVQNGIITIIEVKYQHTTDAWWQVRRLYEPVLREIFSEMLWDFRMLEIVKWYDPDVRWPEPLRLVSEVEHAANLDFDTTGVHIWKP